jgi:EAL domain-containing protein (putative c-di-GMP-specific phosphodiesterase class I)
VISLACGLGMEVVAEGIETAAQLGTLRGLTCDRGQGFWFSRPLPAGELEILLSRASGEALRLGTLQADRPASQSL